ncbi:MAG: hypothetical protein AAF401_14970, partial [Pseudomonadota bacterium]
EEIAHIKEGARIADIGGAACAEAIGVGVPEHEVAPDALANLCSVDFGTDKLLRYLHDWGVVCGVVPNPVDNQPQVVQHSQGVILDKSGKLAEVPESIVKVQELATSEFNLFGGLDGLEDAFRTDDVCLALAIGDGGQIETYLAGKERAFGPKDPSLISLFQECLEQDPPYQPEDDFTSAAPKQKDAVDKIFYGASNPKFAAGQGLDGQEAVFGRQYTDEYIAGYKAHVGSEKESALIDQKIAEIDRTHDTRGLTGRARETRLLQREAAVYTAVQQRNAERLRDCLCNAFLPRCPVLGDEPHLVPIARLKGFVEGGVVVIEDVCVFGCRKQAMSWRMVQHYMAELRDQIAEFAHLICCAPIPAPDQQDETGKPGGSFALDAYKLNQAPQVVTPAFFGAQASKSLEIVTGQKAPNEYSVTPKVEDLSEEIAKEALAGDGIEVAQVIELNDDTAVQKLRDASVGIEAKDLVTLDQGIMPGDKVALIVQNGVAVDYVKVEEGGGKAIFDQTPITKGGASGGKEVFVVKDTEEAVKGLEDRVKAAKEAAAAAEADLKLTLDQQAKLTQDVDAASKELVELAAQREALTKAIEDGKTAANAEIAKISEDQAAALAAARSAHEAELAAASKAQEEAIAASRKALEAETAAAAEAQEKALAEVQKEREAMVVAIRRETPVTAAIGSNDRFASVLAERKVTNLATLAEMPDAQLTLTARSAGVNINTARRMQRDAQAQINAPVQ